MEIAELVAKQRAFFRTGATLPLSFRHEALGKLRKEILAHEEEISGALRADLGKCASESYLCEVGMTLSELSYLDRHMDRWSRPRRVATPLAQFHARSFTVREPYGVALVMSPWNYPFLLTIEPLLGALACGNCCVLKPSAYAPATSAVIRDLIARCFPPEYVAVVEGGRAENQALLGQHFDCIFFTGGVAVGKEVMRRAAEHLTPVVLELGGKSPCVVDETAKIDLAAKRIAFGKLLNCGQTCVAPDYVLVHRRVEEKLLERLACWFTRMAGEEPLDNENYPHMIHNGHFQRVMGLISPEKVYFGGKGDPETLKIQPTILRNVTPEDGVMQEEIFGPVLPVLVYDHMDEAVAFLNDRPHPLACYLFSENPTTQRRFQREVPFGGGCINDTIIHLATCNMGFGGVGSSGMGSYHGKKSFEAFSHEKSMVKKSTWMDLPLRYAPYGPIQDRIVRLFLR